MSWNSLDPLATLRDCLMAYHDGYNWAVQTNEIQPRYAERQLSAEAEAEGSYIRLEEEITQRLLGCNDYQRAGFFGPLTIRTDDDLNGLALDELMEICAIAKAETGIYCGSAE